MSKTVKAVVIFSSILLACLIIVGIIFGVYFGKGKDFDNFSGLLGNGIEINESIDFSLEDIDSLDIECSSADIEFIDSNTPKVELTGTIWTRNKQDKYLQVDKNGDTMNIVLKLERQRPFNFYNVDLNIKIYIPKDNMLDLSIKNSSGNLDIDDMAFGDLNVQNSSGNSLIKNVSAGEVVHKLTSGNTIIKSCEFSSLDVDCSSGGVKIYDTVADTNVGCTSGNVLLESVEGKIYVNSTSGKVTINMASADIDDIKAKITSGNINIGLFEDTAFDIEASVTSGRIRLELPVEIVGAQSSSSVFGSRNGGGSLIDLNSTSGNITISSVD